MTEVHVVFPRNGDPAIVVDDHEACVRNHHLVWHIRSENEAIKRVRLEFRNKNDTFFDGLTAIDADMPAYEEPPGAPPSGPRRSCQMVWGQAPDLSSSVGRRRSKYTVFGQDSRGNDVVEPLDPMILITNDN